MCFLTKEGQKTIKNIINWWFQSKTVSIWYALVLLMVILFPLKFNVLLFLPILEGKINFQSSIISCSSINYEAAALAGLFSSYPKIRLNLNKNFDTESFLLYSKILKLMRGKQHNIDVVPMMISIKKTFLKILRFWCSNLEEEYVCNFNTAFVWLTCFSFIVKYYNGDGTHFIIWSVTDFLLDKI